MVRILLFSDKRDKVMEILRFRYGDRRGRVPRSDQRLDRWVHGGSQGRRRIERLSTAS
jgi:hypothetical protein